MNERDEILTEAAGELYKKLEDKGLKAVSMEAVFDALGIDYTGPYLLPEDVKALADLLMPPTCRMKYDEDSSGDEYYPTMVYRCSECGGTVFAGKPNHCPGCGAVVEK